MQFRKPELIPLLFMVAAVLLLAGLGAWQVERLQWKNELLKQIEQAQAQPPLTALPAAIDDLSYRKVRLRGTFLNGKTLREVTNPRGGVQGFMTLTPFRLERDKRIILINRGFAPEGKATTLSGMQTVEGVLRPARERKPFMPANQPEKNLWFHEDISAMENAAGITLLPLVVEATGTREEGIYPTPSNGKIVLRNDHLGYAITWFTLAILGIIMFAFYNRKTPGIRYISTRGSAPDLPFDEAVLAGLASDGGLYVPATIPAFSHAEIIRMRNLSYPELAYKIISRFTGDSIKPRALRRIINDSYKTFRHPETASLVRLDDHTYILELFHGPTLAFKDFALQFLGRLLNHILEQRNQKVAVIGATSGDTGSAAIAGCSGKSSMDIFILHPRGRVSDVQRRQMTTVTDENVHNLAIDGTFDDCQNIVKSLFSDADFRERYHLTAVNSINWARILAQVVYYFYAAIMLGAPEKRISFAVPTGNFGDIYAGYIAKKMGLPIDQLIIATNSNDILSRCLATGTYGMGNVVQTLSPSMDIQVSSNFERLLFDLYGRNGAAVSELMTELKRNRAFTLSPAVKSEFGKTFAAASVNDDETLDTIRNIHKFTGYLLDPHTAVGLAAARKCDRGNSPLVVLATAHPAKFPDAVRKATGVHPELPAHLSDLLTKQERFDALPSDIDSVKTYIKLHSQ